MRLILCLALLFQVGCSKPQEKIIPLDKSKWDGELRPVMGRLSDEDRNTLKAYLDRLAPGGDHRANRVPPGTTIAEAIRDERQFKVERAADIRRSEQRQLEQQAEFTKVAKEREEQRARLEAEQKEQTETRTKEAARKLEEMKRVADDKTRQEEEIKIRLYESITIKSFEVGSYNWENSVGTKLKDFLFTFKVENSTNRKIRAAGGVVTLFSPLKVQLAVVPFELLNSLEAGETTNVSYDSKVFFDKVYRAKEDKLRELATSQIETALVLERVVFEDGEVLEQKQKIDWMKESR